MKDELQTPCYVIASDGNKYSISYEDGWCYGGSEFLGTDKNDDARDIIKDHIRRAPRERNGIPLYFISDHGNINRQHTIKLRKGI